MSNAVQTQLIIEKESTFNTAPVAGAAKVLRFSQESLGLDSSFSASPEIRADRQVASHRKMGQEGSGDIQGILSYGTYDEMLASVLQSSGWSTEADMSGTPTLTVASSVITRSTGSFVTDGFLVNQWIRMDGWTGANVANNHVFKIAAVGTTTLTVRGSIADVGSPASGVNMQMGQQIVNGVTQDSYTIERENTDLTNSFQLMTGAVLSSLGVKLAADNFIQLTFGVKYADESSETSSFDASPTAAGTDPEFSCSQDVLQILETYSAYDVTELSFTIDNKIRTRRIVGQQEVELFKSGRLEVTGTHSAYYASSSIMNKFLAETVANLSIPVQDTDGNYYVIEFPNTKYTAGRRVAGGVDTDIMAAMSWVATLDPTEGITCRITRWDAV